MPRFKFATFEPPPEADQPEIELGGVVFKCAAGLPARAYIAMALYDRATLQAASFIGACLATEADAQAFDDLLGRRDVIIRGEELADIVATLMEFYAQRPTTPPSASHGRPPADGGASEGGSSNTGNGSRN